MRNDLREKKNFLIFFGMETWKKNPVTIRNARSLFTFKDMFKKILFRRTKDIIKINVYCIYRFKSKNNDNQPIGGMCLSTICCSWFFLIITYNYPFLLLFIYHYHSDPRFTLRWKATLFIKKKLCFGHFYV